MRQVGRNSEGFWYQQADAPPVFVPRQRALYQPIDNAHYAQGMVAPGKAQKRGYYTRLIPGESTIYAQRPGAPPVVLPPSQVKGEAGGVGVVAKDFAFQYRGAVYAGPLLDIRTGTPVASGMLINNGETYLSPIRDVTTVFFVDDGTSKYLLVAAPGVRVEVPVTTAPLLTWTVPYGQEVIIEGIDVEDGNLLFFE